MPITASGAFTAGDVVKLKCDGPNMVVDSFDSLNPGSPSNVIPEYGAKCHWFDTTGVLHSSVFGLHLLDGIKSAKAERDRIAAEQAAQAAKSAPKDGQKAA